MASNLKLSLNLASYLEKTNSPQCRDLYGGDVNSMTADMMAYVWATPPTAPGPVTMAGYTTPEGTEVPGNEVVASIYNTDIKNNKYGDVNRRGYQENTNMNLNSSLILDWGLGYIIKGLSTKFMVAFDAASSTSLTATRLFDLYQAGTSTNSRREVLLQSCNGQSAECYWCSQSFKFIQLLLKLTVFNQLCTSVWQT